MVNRNIKFKENILLVAGLTVHLHYQLRTYKTFITKTKATVCEISGSHG
jgi:hypothetical protein